MAPEPDGADMPDGHKIKNRDKQSYGHNASCETNLQINKATHSPNSSMGLMGTADLTRNNKSIIDQLLYIYSTIDQQ